MRLCSQCGEDNPDDAQFCVNCGASLQPAEEPPTLEAPAPPASFQSPPPVSLPVPPPPMNAGAIPPPGTAAQPRSQMGLWAFLFGLASFVCCCGFLAPVAIVLGVQARKDPTADQGLAVAGLVLGIIMAVVTVISVIIFIIIALVADSASTALVVPRPFAC